jgi:hypothetical protein
MPHLLQQLEGHGALAADDVRVVVWRNEHRARGCLQVNIAISPEV